MRNTRRLATLTTILALALMLAPAALATELSRETGGNGVVTDLPWTTTSFLTQTLSAQARNAPSGDGRALRLAIDLSVGGVSTTLVDDPLNETADGRFAADIHVLPATAPFGPPARRGIVFRANPATMFGDAYQFVFDFDGTLVFRAFVGGAGMTLRRWDATEMPGGLAQPFSWHRLEAIALGDSFRLLYDGRELPSSPVLDSTLMSSGRSGFYTFHFSADSAAEIGIFDDFVAEDLGNVILSVGTPLDYVRRGDAAQIAAFAFNASGEDATRTFRLVFVDRGGIETVIAERTLTLRDGQRVAKELPSVRVPVGAHVGPGRFRFESDLGESAEVFVEVTP